MKLFIVTEEASNFYESGICEIIGVFDSKEKAETAIRNHETELTDYEVYDIEIIEKELNSV